MESFLAYVEVVGALIAAFGLAVGLEWVGLYGLTSMMSHRADRPGSGANSDGVSPL